MINFNLTFVTDNDECALGTHDCDINAQCSNTQGRSFVPVIQAIPEMESHVQVGGTLYGLLI